MRTTLWRELPYGFAAAAAAMLAMAAIAAAGVQLTNMDRYGEGTALTAATVVLAASGAVDLSLHIDGLPLQGHGALQLRPLGVSLAGAVAFGAVLLLAVRHRPASGPALAIRAASAAVGFAALAGLASRLGRATVTVPVAAADGPGEVVIGFHPGPVRAVAGALVWAVVVLGLCWLGSVRSPVPARWRRWREPLRQVVIAAFAVAMAGVVLVVAGAVPAAARADEGPALLGGALLTGPAVLVVLVTVGLGGSWTASLTGPLGEQLGARLADLGGGTTLSLSRLAATSDRPGWLVPAGLAAAVLLGCGAAVAARTPARATAVRAGLLGAVLGVAMPALAALAGVTVEAGLSFLGREFPVVEARLHTSLLLAAALGLAGGTAAALLASLAMRPLTRWRAGRGGRADRRSPSVSSTR